jgi:anti-sigma factor RsiW
MKFRSLRPSIVCRRAVELMADYLDDALPARDRATLERHLRQCPHCAAYLAQLRATIAATGRAEATDLTPDARAALVELYRRTRRDNVQP